MAAKKSSARAASNKPKPDSTKKSGARRAAAPARSRAPKKGAKSAAKQPAAPPDKVKKKPPSITITRPEATRPPVVVLPPPKVEAPIGAPSILVPKGGQPTNSLTPILRWMYVGGATRYEVEMSHDAHFGRGHSTSMVSLQTAITLDQEHALQPSTTYQWRVRGGNDAGWGPWSAPASFRSPDK